MRIPQHRRLRPAAWVGASWVMCGFLPHCIQLEDRVEATVDGLWTGPQQIDSEGLAPEAALNSDGDGVVVWTRSGSVWLRRVDATGSWLAPERIPSADVQGDAAVGIDQTGVAVAVWSQFFPQRDVSVFSNRCSPVEGCGFIELVSAGHSSGDTAADSPRVAVNADGVAVAVWVQFDGTRDDVWSSRYTEAVGWAPPEPIESSDALRASSPQVAIDPDGNAVAVWSQPQDDFDIWSNVSGPSGGWRAKAFPLDARDAGDATDARIAMDDRGNAVAVWQQSDGSRANIWAARFTPSGHWQSPERIDRGGGEGNALSGPDVAVSPGGTAVALWIAANQEVWSNRRPLGGVWGEAQKVTMVTVSALDPRVAVAPDGTAVAVWRRLTDRGSSIWSSRYVPNRGWSSELPIDTDHEGVAIDPRVVADLDGTVLAVWAVVGGPNPGIWSNRFVDTLETN